MPASLGGADSGFLRLDYIVITRKNGKHCVQKINLKMVSTKKSMFEIEKISFEKIRDHRIIGDGCWFSLCCLLKKK